MDVPTTWQGVVDDLSNQCDRELLERIVAGMRTHGDPSIKDPITPSRAWNYIIDFGFAHKNGKYGWAQPDGGLLSVGYGGHEKLLAFLGMDVPDAIQSGWVRIGPNGWSSRYKVTREQRRCIENAGHVVDKAEERLKDPLPAHLRPSAQKGVADPEMTLPPRPT